jgi:DNA-binding MarR family transcriptional regulator
MDYICVYKYFGSVTMTKPATNIEAIATSCIAGRLRLLNRVITNLYDDALRPFGLKLSQGSVLAVTAKLGLARPAQVCEILEMDTSTLSRTVERMVSNGWLEIVPEEDGRSQPFRLTAEGRRLMERAFPAWEQAQAEAKKLLGNDGLRLLDAAIGRVKTAHAGA